MAVYKPLSPEAVKQMAKRAVVMPRNVVKTYDMAVDYLENRQLDDTRGELEKRFPATQQGEAGQRIEPISFSLVERYVAEAANAYNKPVKRELVSPTGETNDATKAQTDALNKMLDKGAYDEVLHRVEQLSVLLECCGLNYETKRGKLSASIKLPQSISPCRPERSEFVDKNDPDDYDGYVIGLHGATPTVTGASGKEAQKVFMVATNAETQFWLGADPTRLTKRLSTFENPYEWSQVVDEVDIESGELSSAEKVVGGRMLTFWHRRYPISGVIPTVDPDIVALNRELNIAWASLLDVIKMQGFSVPVITLANKTDVKAKRRYGARWPLILKIGETFQLASAATSFNEQVAVLKDLVKLCAMLHRLSPNDFSMDAAAAQSGFAKVVDAIPKIEARQERIKRLTRMEQEEAWPRIRAIGISLGLLDESTKEMELRATFAGVEYPMTQDERAKKFETDTKFSISTRAEILAHEKGLSVEEAKRRIGENDKENADLVTPDGEDLVATGSVEESIAPAANSDVGDVQKTALNGAQVTAMLDAVRSAAAKELPRDSVVNALVLGFQVSKEDAEKIVGAAGASFTISSDGEQQRQPTPQKKSELGAAIGRRDRQQPMRKQ